MTAQWIEDNGLYINAEKSVIHFFPHPRIVTVIKKNQYNFCKRQNNIQTQMYICRTDFIKQFKLERTYQISMS